jgi:hypothetical protein
MHSVPRACVRRAISDASDEASLLKAGLCLPSDTGRTKKLVSVHVTSGGASCDMRMASSKCAIMTTGRARVVQF